LRKKAFRPALQSAVLRQGTDVGVQQMKRLVRTGKFYLSINFFQKTEAFAANASQGVSNDPVLKLGRSLPVGAAAAIERRVFKRPYTYGRKTSIQDTPYS
jgi:hypothetical protein